MPPNVHLLTHSVARSGWGGAAALGGKRTDGTRSRISDAPAHSVASVTACAPLGRRRELKRDTAAREAHNGELRSSAVSSSGGRGGDGSAGAYARCIAVGVRRIGAESRTELRDRRGAPGVITNRDLRGRSRQPIRLAGSLPAPISPSALHRAFSEAQIPTASRHARSF